MDKKTKTRINPRTNRTAAAKLVVAQTYWMADQDYKAAESKRSRVRELALLALRKGETVGPVYDGHWLTHGEKERVEMNPYVLNEIIPDPLEFCTVNVAALKEQHPLVYAKLLKHKTTRRTSHSCLTWSTTPPRRRGRV